MITMDWSLDIFSKNVCIVSDRGAKLYVLGCYMYGPSYFGMVPLHICSGAKLVNCSTNLVNCSVGTFFGTYTKFGV